MTSATLGFHEDDQTHSRTASSTGVYGVPESHPFKRRRTDGPASCAMLDAKTQKYDRQLRLWAASGQAALESAHVCLINSTATGTEVLKNLVLPGIGSFTLVDKSLVEPADTGNNFFVSAVGEPRAKITKELLNELNEDVRGTFIVKDASEIIRDSPEFFLNFSVVIATGLPETDLLKLGEILWTAQIPLFVVRVCGFMGYLRIVVPEHCIVETHPEHTLDLRLDLPFSALREAAESFGEFDSMDDHMHAHIPYVIILYKYLQKWAHEHGGRIPSTYAEKSEFRNFVLSGARSADDENFDEAAAAVLRVCTETKVPQDVKEIFADSKCAQLDGKSSNFWIIVRAIKEFVAEEGEGLLPLSGKLPDMKADTDRYIRLQDAYKQKARADAAAVMNKVVGLLESVGRPHDSVSMDEVEMFCKHAAVIKVMRYRSFAEEYSEQPGIHRGKEIGRILESGDPNVVQYVLFRAADLFYARFQHYPGDGDNDMEKDFCLLTECVTSVLSRWNLPVSAVDEEHMREMCRAGNSELQAVAALMGGLAAQEVIKVVTRQYIPLNNTCIFNGLTSASSTFVF